MISVLMSLYKKENPDWFRKSLDSITTDQERRPDEVVLVCDGPLTDELEEIITRFEIAGCVPLRTVRLSRNEGLGIALKEGLDACRGELVARMDTDDIAEGCRLRLQEEFMNAHPDIAACGGEIAEFINEGETIRLKHMPSSPGEVHKYGKTRNPLNHMTVMFRKSAVLAAGGYQHFPLLEDYHLWSRMLADGDRIANLNTVLVNARIGSTFAERRGGRDYYDWYKKLRHLQLEWGYLNKHEYRVSLALTFAMTRQSARSRERAYRILRKG